MNDKPEPPEGLAEYVSEGLERQDAAMLREISEFAVELAEWKEQEPLEDVDELAGDAEEIVDSEQTGSGTIVEKMIPCGKENCDSCPHGPYRYRAYREGDDVVTEYIGKA